MKANLNNINESIENGKNFFITFDDGYKDNYTISFPLLQKYSIPSIFFITTGIIGSESLLWHDYVRYFFETRNMKNVKNLRKLKKECKQKLEQLKLLDEKDFSKEVNKISHRIKIPARLMMTWDEIKFCHDNGIIIAPHTNTHCILSKLNRQNQEDEILISMATIQSKLKCPAIVHFSFPNGKIGSFNEITIDILTKNGIKNVYLTEAGKNDSRSHNEKINRFKRIGVNPSDPIPFLMLKIINTNLRKIKSFQRIKQIHSGII